MAGRTRRVPLTSLVGAVSLNGGCLAPAKEIQVIRKNIIVNGKKCMDGENTATISDKGAGAIEVKGHINTDTNCDELLMSVYTSKNSERIIVEIIADTPADVDCQTCESIYQYNSIIELNRAPSRALVKYRVNGKMFGTVAERSLS